MTQLSLPSQDLQEGPYRFVRDDNPNLMRGGLCHPSCFWGIDSADLSYRLRPVMQTEPQETLVTVHVHQKDLFQEVWKKAR